jgi:GrpB-like predicted nucleotidyltransferase (UPF0157 family)
MVAGLQRGVVLLEPHDPAWSAAFAAERDLLLAVLGRHIVALEHVGSTAVPGVDAKPIIDIAVAVRDATLIGEWAPLLAPLGYTYFDDRSGIGDFFFAKGPEACRTVYLHAMTADSGNWCGYLRFRDRLRRDPGLRRAYTELKRDLAVKHAGKRNAYTDAKASFILGVIRGAQPHEPWNPDSMQRVP